MGEEAKEVGGVEQTLWLDKLTTVAMWVAALGVVLAFLLVNYGVVARYFFNTSPTWVDDTVGYLLVLVVMAASAKNLYKAQHLYVDILTSYLTKRKPQWRVYFDLWAQASVLLLCALVIYSSIEGIQLSMAFGLTTTDNVQAPMHYLLALILIGAVLMGCVALVSVVQKLGQIIKG